MDMLYIMVSLLRWLATQTMHTDILEEKLVKISR